MLKFAYGLWQYPTGSTIRARMVNMLTVRAHGQYNHRLIIGVNVIFRTHGRTIIRTVGYFLSIRYCTKPHS